MIQCRIFQVNWVEQQIEKTRTKRGSIGLYKTYNDPDWSVEWYLVNINSCLLRLCPIYQQVIDWFIHSFIYLFNDKTVF